MAEAEKQSQQFSSQPLKYKTSVLKVFIHCEGCKKKVRRILHNIEGVYTIDIDSKLHKVTVTGNIDDYVILIEHLQKSGKHAEPYPNNPNPNPNNNNNKPTKPNKNNKTKNTNNATNSIEPNPADAPNLKHQDCGDSVEESSTTINQMAAEAEEKNKIQKMGSSEKEISPAPPEKKVNESPGGGSGSDGKKKKKIGQNGNNNSSKNEISGPVDKQAKTESQPSVEVPNSGPQISHQVWEGPSGYHTPTPTSAYVVSYNTAFPSHMTSYYAEEEVPLGYYGNVVDVEMGQPLDWSGDDERGPSDSFSVFSEENPNACSIM